MTTRSDRRTTFRICALASAASLTLAGTAHAEGFTETTTEATAEAAAVAYADGIVVNGSIAESQAASIEVKRKADKREADGGRADRPPLHVRHPLRALVLLELRFHQPQVLLPRGG